ncbi:adenylosuccinate synthetase [Pandoraea sp. XY-2]|uniref:adenylosuccinate synthetase n=1 Tax=Pandoraea sp. XY-2 TaxID=2518599 RepID=UPI00101B08F3|nr:adenylosuccinate synthetase [Pandoraea sp. XY-2]QBC30655.1 adenylosuccinate synthetase [Pandoraea sp. XY-2]
MSAGSGYADVLVGLQYGDEGKAKIVDMLAADYDIVARFNGGANAGHTVQTPRASARLAQVPSGVFHSGKLLYIGSGCVVNLTKLSDEITTLRNAGCRLATRLYLSEHCTVIQPVHLDLDAGHGAGIGTTGNGIGPCYADLSLRWRRGIRTVVQIRDLVADEAGAFEQMARYAALHNNSSEALAATTAAITGMRAAWRGLQSTIVVADSRWLTRRVKGGARVLFEGAQSVMLDVTGGQQPYVTASHTAPAFAFVGGDLPSQYHRKTIGVAKAIASRVGAGPFRSEFGGDQSARYCADAELRGIGWREEQNRFNAHEMLGSEDEFAVGVALRLLTGEYGTGSGRPRRLGRLDLAELAAVIERHGVDELYLNKCDCLSLFSKTRDGRIPVLVDEAREGRWVPTIRHFPAFDALPDTPLAFSLLPSSLQQFVLTVQEMTACRVAGIGVGPGREQQLIISTGDMDYDA